MCQILVVEDDKVVRETLCEILKKNQYDVVSAKDGKDGLKKAATAGADVVLLDINLPKMNGYEICRRLKKSKDTRRIPIVMMTGLSQKEEKLKGLKAGADEFLTKPVDINELLVRIRSLAKVKKLNEDLEEVDNILHSLISIIDAKDSYTRQHSDRVKKLSLRLAAYFSLSKEQIAVLMRAAELHDIGKIGVSENLLNKPGQLSKEEFEAIKQHSVIGEKLCSPLKSLAPILKIIRHHHERFDGRGYPDGIRGEAISIETRIIAVADSYDAMSSDRPYRARLSADKILREFNEGKNKQWDEQVVNVLIKLLKGKIGRGFK